MTSVPARKEREPGGRSQQITSIKGSIHDSEVVRKHQHESGIPYCPSPSQDILRGSASEGPPSKTTRLTSSGTLNVLAPQTTEGQRVGVDFVPASVVCLWRDPTLPKVETIQPGLFSPTASPSNLASSLLASVSGPGVLRLEKTSRPLFFQSKHLWPRQSAQFAPDSGPACSAKVLVFGGFLEDFVASRWFLATANRLRDFTSR